MEKVRDVEISWNADEDRGSKEGMKDGGIVDYTGRMDFKIETVGYCDDAVGTVSMKETVEY